MALSNSFRFWLSACVACTLLASSAAADVFLIGPYVTRVDEKSAVVIWVGPSTEEPGRIEIEPADDGASKEFSAELTLPPFNDSVMGGTRDDVRHLVRVEGLEPSTRYVYRAYAPDGEGSREGSFKTAPIPGARERFRFLVGSDTHGGHGSASAIAREDKDFLIITGDFIGGRGNDFPRWLSFFDSAQQYLQDTVMFPVVGGHDVYPAHNYRAFWGLDDPQGDFPYPADSDSAYFTMTYGNSLFIALDQYTEDQAEQLQWLEEVLSTHTAEWVFAAFHEPTFSVGSRGRMSDFPEFVDLFQKYGVDFVFSGHNHIYERMLPLGAEGEKPVNYIQTYSGGGRRAVRPGPIVAGSIGTSLSNYVIVEVEGNELEMLAKHADGTEIERLRLVKTDGMYQQQFMNQAVEVDLARQIAHAYSAGGRSAGTRERRDIYVEFRQLPQPGESATGYLDTRSLPAGSRLSVSPHPENDCWTVEDQVLDVDGGWVAFEFAAPPELSFEGTGITPALGLKLNVEIEGRWFEPGEVEPTLGPQTQALLTVTQEVPSDAEIYIWEGYDGDGEDWFDPDNWNPKAVPGDDAVVVIREGARLRLSDETAALESFTMLGGELIVQGWETALRAKDVSFSGGVVTLPPAFTDNESPNRVWIVCEDFTLGSGARIDVRGRGYAGRYGPGANLGGQYSSGAGHGGLGGPSRGNHGWAEYGPVYGSVEAPTDPGSEGGSATVGTIDAAGGGAVLIEAGGRVTIESTIDARGVEGNSSQRGPGSGGSIFIRCNTFAGSERGELLAGGADRMASSGISAGGRIAVVYDPVAQQQIESVNPGVRFSAPRGGRSGRRAHAAESGTLYLPDTLFLSDNVVGKEFDDVNVFIPGFSEWATTGDVTIQGKVGFPELESVAIDGNLTLESGTKLRVFGGEADDIHGMSFTITGELLIESRATLSSTMYAFKSLFNEYDGRAPAYFQVGSLIIADGGTLLAPTLEGGSGYGPASGPGAGQDEHSGGGYGGAGGGDAGGIVYGTAHAPLKPGSGGGHPETGGRGGGLILVSATERVRVDGTISADGCDGNYTSSPTGGSGGAIMITTRAFEGSGGELRANGHSASRGYSGGGGRIAVWTPQISLNYLARMADGYMPSASTFIPSDGPGFEGGTAEIQWQDFTGTVSVIGPHETAGHGTVFFGELE